MTPLKLTLKNFLSYQDATLDFTGFHTACICGVNGAGKSSLLEAVTWAIWGESRTATADDVIHGGEMDVRVDFELMSNQQVYKIIRMRSRGKSGSLQFQVRSPSGDFISLTSKGMRETQDHIIHELKLDYETFINSAYLRQGRADEFMVAKPAERKKILGNLLKLDQYETLSQLAKDQAKEFKLKADILEQSFAPNLEKLAAREQIQTEWEMAGKAIAELNQRQDQDRATLKDLQVVANQRQTWEQQLSLQQQSFQRRQQENERLNVDIGRSQQDLEKNLALLNQAAEIETQYQHWQELQRQEETFNQKFQQYQDLQNKLQQTEQQIQKQEGDLQIQIRRIQARLEDLDQQEKDFQKVLLELPKIASALAKLEQARTELNRLDSLQSQVSPLLQKRQDLENQILRAAEKLTVKLESLEGDRQQLSQQIAQIPEQRQRLQELNHELAELDKKRIYQDRVRDKKLDQARQRERLQESQRNCHKQLEELQQKLNLLNIPEATCPLCDQDLDHDHREHVLAKTQQQQTATEAEIWRLKEQLLQCDQELTQYETELNQLQKALSEYTEYEQQFFKIETELDRNNDIQKILQRIEAEIETLGRSLNLEAYAEDLRTELAEVNVQLQTLKYDERSHAIAREEEKQWRWAEIKQSKLEDAQKSLTRIEQQKPELIMQLQQTKNQLETLHENSPLQQQSRDLITQLQVLNYDRSEHQNLSQNLRTAQIWQLRQQELKQAQEQHDALKNRLQELQETQTLYQEDLQQIQAQIREIQENIDQFSDHRTEINQLEIQIQQRRQELDHNIAHQGQLQQSLQHLETLATEHEVSKTELAELRREYRVYKELGNAFGKNGIQTLMIENALPQLEAETNHILSRLTGNQFHVQFLTQKAKKGSKKVASKMIDTLDILIADARGTRAYETYSGGEAFRINFSIRLALAKLLAHRSGTALQMLIIDEGFGTQDAEGCARLIAAINTIADDFACILAVTHIPQFKEAFQSRIEVYKDKQGSQIRVNN